MNTFNQAIKNLTKNTVESFLRFPIVIGLALIVTITGICMIYLNGIYLKIPLKNILLCAGLGIPLQLSITIVNEELHSAKKWGLHLIGFLLLVFVYYTLPNKENALNSHKPYIFYTALSVVVHLFLSFAPFSTTKSLLGFWSYNKMLFLRTFSSLLFSGVLYIGTTIALALITYLFNVEIESEIYAAIAIFYGSLVNIWIFMAGIPERILDIEHTELFPKRLRFFAQYVLLPLLILYIIILISYLLKIGFTFTLPKGGLSYLILGVSILGILTFLLLYPYSNLEDGAWLKVISKTYYYILTPLSCVLLYVLFYRISEYGITINRYMLTLSSFWILGISLYFNLKGNDIRIIPISLAIVTILSLFGPWSMFSVSEKSQLKILTELLAENKLLKNGKLIYENIPNEKAPYFNSKRTNSLYVDSQNRIISIAKYLHYTHGLEVLQPIFTQNLSLFGNESYNDLREYSLMEDLMGLSSEYAIAETQKTTRLQKEFSEGVKSSNYDWVFPIEKGNYNSNFNETFHLENEVSLEINGDFEVRILKNDADILTYNLEPFANTLLDVEYKNSTLTDEKMTIEIENKVLKVKFVFSEIELKENGDDLYLDNYKGYVLTRWKK